MVFETVPITKLMGTMETESSLFKSINASNSNWDGVLPAFQGCLKKSTNVPILCVNVIQKTNAAYDDLCEPVQRQADALLQLCHSSLIASDWSKKMASKYKISLGKILANLSVKTIYKSCLTLTISLCDLLLSIAMDECLDDSAETRHSIAGYVYRSLWNSSINPPPTISRKQITELRLMALQLAVAGTCRQPVYKLSQQLGVTLLCMNPNSGFEAELKRLKLCSLLAVKRMHDNIEWKQLAVYIISCLVIIEPETYYEAIQIDFELEPFTSLSTRLLTGYVNVINNLDSNEVASDIREYLLLHQNRIEMDCFSLISVHIRRKVVEKLHEQNIWRVSWKDLVKADILIQGRLSELNGLTDRQRQTCLDSVCQSLLAYFNISSKAIHATTLSQSMSSAADVIAYISSSNLISLFSTANILSLVKSVGRLITAVSKLSASADSDVIHNIYQLGCHSLILTGKSHVELQEINVSLRKALCDFLLKREAYQEALDTFNSASQLSEIYWAELITYWVTIKKAAATAGNTSHCNRILGPDVFIKTVNKDDLIKMIHREYSAYSFKECYSNELSNCLQSLKSYAVTDSHRCLYNLCQAELSINLNKDSQLIQSYIADSLSCTNNSLSVFTKDFKAQLYLLQYISLCKPSCEMQNVEAALTTRDYSGSACTFNSETQALDPIYQAVDLWSQCAADKDNNQLYSNEKTLECLDVVVQIFYLSNRYNRVLTTSKLAARLSDGCLIPASLIVCQIKALVQLGDASAAKTLLEKLQSSEKPFSVPNKETLSLLKAEIYASQDETESAVKILESIIASSNRSSLDSVFNAATSHRLMVEIVLNCTSVSMQQTLMYHVWYCQRDHSCIYTSLSTHPVKSFGAKLKYLDALLSSYTTVGKAYLFTGNAREADCFLNAADNLYKLLRLPLRGAEIAVIQAKLNCFVGDFLGCEARTRHANTILNSKLALANSNLTERLLTKQSQVENVKKSKEPVSKSVKQAKESRCFGFDSDSEDNLDIHQPDDIESDDDSYGSPKYNSKPLTDPTASPTLKRQKHLIKLEGMEYLTHNSVCDCLTCEEHMLHVRNVDAAITFCELQYLQGSPLISYEHAMNSLGAIDWIEKNCDFRINRTSKHNALLSRKLSLYNIIMWCHLLLDQHAAFMEQWKMVKNLSVIPSSSYQMTAIKYLSLIPKINEYFMSIINSRSELMLYDLTLNEVTSSPLQPIKTSSLSRHPFGSAVKAPRKTRRVAASFVNMLAFDDSDDETKPKSQTTKSSKNTSVMPTEKKNNRRQSAKKISVFCDDNQAVKSSKKPNTRLSNKKNCKSSEAEEETTRTRSRRTTSRELIRSVTNESVSIDLPSICESPIAAPVCSPSNIIPDLSVSSDGLVSAPGIDFSDDIELPRGDKAAKKKSQRRSSGNESIRASIPLTISSPPEITGSPVIELSPSASLSTSGSIGELIGNLTNIWESFQAHPPYPMYRYVSQALGLLHYHMSDMWNAAFYFTESQAVSFTHKSHTSSTNKHHASMKEGGSSSNAPSFSMPAKRSLKEFKNVVNSLPSGWVMCNVNVVSLYHLSPDQMIILVRLERDKVPIVVSANGVRSPQEIWKEFHNILTASKDSLSETVKSRWWEIRKDLDNRLKNLLASLQKDLGVARSAMIGCYDDKKSRYWVEKCTDKVMSELNNYSVSCSRQHIQMLVNGAESLSEKELSSHFNTMFPVLKKEQTSRLSILVKEGVAVMNDTREHVILALDKEAQALCWEYMPYMSEHSVSRMPSIYAVKSYLDVYMLRQSCVYNSGIDSKKVYYVLNPDNNLDVTEQTFKKTLTGLKDWKGVIGRKPTAQEYKNGLMLSDVFIYIGHGSGSKYLKPRDLCQIDCEAAVLLMGCSSGAFDCRGQMEPSGIIYDYHIARCPSVLACLWDVTDKDIDRFTDSLIKRWLFESDDKLYLSQHISSARRSCKLPYLVGCASVVYGLPVHIRTEKIG